jgi:hypothetical protein
MKISLSIIVSVFFCIIGNAQTNLYHPFPTSGTYWRESSGGYQSGFCADYQDFIIGDTVIGGLIYNNIRRIGVTYYEDTQGFCTSIITGHFSEYMGAYRNDSINKKVYLFSPSLSVDTLLYDFNLNQFDTLHPTFLYDPNWGATSFVSEIDSVLIGSSYHKRFWISSSFSTNYVQLIEGIGSTFGLLAQIVPPFESGSLLSCVIQDGVTVYPDSSYMCELVEGVPEFLKHILTFNISPNPNPGFTTVNFVQKQNTVNLLIFDLFGVVRLRIFGIKNGEKINLSNLNSGLYIYQALQENSIISTGKIIKTN